GQAREGLPGNDWLTGVTDPPHVHDPRFLVRWLTSVPGRIVELTCHPGYHDHTLVGRDCTTDDGQQQRRVREFELLRHSSFFDACRQAGLHLVAPTEFARVLAGTDQRAA